MVPGAERPEHPAMSSRPPLREGNFILYSGIWAHLWLPTTLHHHLISHDPNPNGHLASVVVVVAAAGFVEDELARVAGRGQVEEAHGVAAGLASLGHILLAVVD